MSHIIHAISFYFLSNWLKDIKLWKLVFSRFSLFITEGILNKKRNFEMVEILIIKMVCSENLTWSDQNSMDFEWTLVQTISDWAKPVQTGSVQFSSVTLSCLTLCDPMNHSIPGLPVHHQLPEFTQTHVHWVSAAIQPSHPLASPSPALNLSQYQSLF